MKLKRYTIKASEDVETESLNNDITELDQEFTSENTSINSTKLPAIFKMVSFQPNSINLDYGGGKFDNVAEYLAETYNATNLVYDPFNRSAEHNSDVIKTIRANGGADTATCSNVLNVIKEPEVRLNVLSNIKKLLKPNGTAYITVYEGSGKGNEGATKSGYQLNRKTADYLDEIQQVFPDASRKGKLIIAPNSTNSNSNIESATELHSMISQNDLIQFGDDVCISVNAKYTNINLSLEDIYIVDYNRLIIDALDILTNQLYSINLTLDEDDFEVSGDLYNYLDKAVRELENELLSIADNIESSAEILGQYESFQDPKLQPPEDNFNEIDSYDEEIEVEIDAIVIVDDSGYLEYEDTDYEWAKSDDLNGDWYSDEDRVRLGDNIDIVEHIDELLDEYIENATPGKYRMTGIANLKFDIEGLWSNDEDEVFTDDADITYLPESSSISNFKLTPVK